MFFKIVLEFVRLLKYVMDLNRVLYVHLLYIIMLYAALSGTLVLERVG